MVVEEREVEDNMSFGKHKHGQHSSFFHFHSRRQPVFGNQRELNRLLSFVLGQKYSFTGSMQLL